MKKVLLLRFGELYLKGKNREVFERKLIDNIKVMLKDEQFVFHATLGRYIISDYAEERENAIVEKLLRVFGLHSLSKAVEVAADKEEIIAEVEKIKIEPKSFKVNVKRADKKFPLTSMEFAALLGERVLAHNASEVDLYTPEVVVNVDIRTNGRAYIFFENILCQGGLPLGTAGKGLLLLSGGFDSPVAGYLMAKRGLELEAVHFHSYPYTSEQAKQKVIDIGRQLTNYCGKIKLHIVSFTKIQEAIHVHCVSEYMITIMRRIMMRIAERICEENELGAIVTGESLGQVASQTMQSMTVAENVVKEKPVFRPCIAMDKEEIMAVAKKIGTHDISILPYEDCCTVFLPKYPVIKPKIEKAEKEEGRLDIEELVDEALKNIETIVLEG